MSTDLWILLMVTIDALFLRGGLVLVVILLAFVFKTRWGLLTLDPLLLELYF